MSEVIVIPPKTSDKRKRVAAYCRVSSTKAEQLSSLKVQKENYESQIRNTSEWDFVGVYCDAESGLKSHKRKGFIELLGKCENGEVDLILVKSISRFGRNMYESLLTLRHLKDIGVDVWSEQENLKLFNYSADSDFALMLIVAQAESESKSENIKFGLKYGFKSGASKLYNRVCYGYTHDENGNLIIDEIKATIVKTIFDMYLNGYSFSGISKLLYECNIKSPSGKDKWSSETISKLLSNEKLSGDVIVQKTFVENYLDGRQIKNDGQRDKYSVQCHHEPVISKELFDAVQEEKRKRSNVAVGQDGSAKRRATRYSNDVLSGKIICSECGANYRRITRNTKKGKVIVWRCANRVEYGNRICKTSITVSNAEIEKAIADKLLLYNYDEKTAHKYIESIYVSNTISVNVKEFEENSMLKIREYQMSRAGLVGDKVAMNLLYEESYDKIKMFIRKKMYGMGISPKSYLMEDFEDICQDAFLKSFMILDKFHGKCRFSTWVTKISFYEICSRFKKLK
jgi:DNA invertase Pin-like site-specific DNA recombinase